MSPSIVKLGGLAGILAAALFLIAAVNDQVAPIELVYDSPNEYVHSAVSMVVFLAGVAAVVGVWALKSRTSQLRRLATLAAWMTGLSYGFVALLNAINLIQGERTLNMVRLGAALVMLISSVILGVIVLVTRLLPWSCGVLMIIAFPLGHFANALFPSAENILYVLLWGSVGLALLARANAPAEPAYGSPRGSAEFEHRVRVEESDQAAPLDPYRQSLPGTRMSLVACTYSLARLQESASSTRPQSEA